MMQRFSFRVSEIIVLFLLSLALLAPLSGCGGGSGSVTQESFWNNVLPKNSTTSTTKGSRSSATNQLPAATLKSIEENTARYNELRKTHTGLPDIEEMRAQIGSKLSRDTSINMSQFYLIPAEGSLLIDFQYQGLIPFLLGGVPGYGAVVMSAYNDGSGTPDASSILPLPQINASKVHLILWSGWSELVPTGAYVGDFTIFYNDGTSSALKLIEGVNIAEWAYDRPEAQATLKHTKIPPAYSWTTSLDSLSSYTGHIFYVELDLQPDKVVNRAQLAIRPDGYAASTNKFGIWVDSMTLELAPPGKLSINDQKAAPAEFDPAESDSSANHTVISATITGDQVYAESMEWQVTVEDSEQQVVKTFEKRTGTPGSGPWDVSETWDGKKDDGKPADAGDYTFRISAAASISGQTCEAKAEGKVAVTAGAVLEIHLNDTGELIASSDDKDIDLPYIGYADNPYLEPVGVALSRALSAEYEVGRKNYILQKKPSEAVNLLVRLTEGPKNENIKQVDVSMENLKFITDNNKVTFKLDRTQTPGIYEGNILIGPPSDSSTSLPYLEMPKITDKDTYSWCDASSASKNATYESDIEDTIEFRTHQTPIALELGGAYNYDRGLLTNWTDFDRNSHVTPVKAALQAGGFTNVSCEYPDGKGKTKRCVLHVKNQAKAFYYSGEGKHSENHIWLYGNIHGSDCKWFYPQDISAGEWNDNLEVIFLNCCSVLDMGDLNRNFRTISGLREHYRNPGKEWLDAVKGSQKFKALLGYNMTAPPGVITKWKFIDSRPDVEIVKTYFEKYLGKSKNESIAWVRANADEYVPCSNYDTACAITKDYYYFIHYRLRKGYYDADHHYQHWFHFDRRIFAVNHNAWVGPEYMNDPERKFELIPKDYRIDYSQQFPLANSDYIESPIPGHN